MFDGRFSTLTRVLSLSYDPDNPYLKDKYSGKSGAILEFENLHYHSISFWHTTPNDDESFSLHHFQYLYAVFEGNVIYDPDVQLKIIDLIIEILPEMIDGEPHVADYASFTLDYILRPFLLSKRNSYSPEDEYRIVLVAKETTDDRFEFTHSIGTSERIYVKARMPGNTLPTILNN